MNGQAAQTATAERIIARPAPERARHPAKELVLAAATLWWREIRGFYRQRSRVVGGLMTPLLFWFVLGSGFGRSIDSSTATRAGYLEFFFPGMLALVVLFAAIFSNISVIEDRREGFLLSVMVAPVPRGAVVMGKVFGAATIGALQGVVLLPLALLLHLPLSLSQLPALLATIGLLSFGLTGLGFAFAWWLNSVQGFHAVMNMVLMPMWLLSGAVFPVEGASAWIRWIMLVNPLSYGVTSLRHVFYSVGSAHEPSAAVCWLVMVAFSIATLAASFLLVSRRTADNLA